jgi:hypothetical protein
MANYKFEYLNSAASIKNPKIKITNISYGNGLASVDVSLSVANAPQGSAPSFGVTFEGFTYVGAEPKTEDIEAWVQTELIKHEV